jgi:hypothetical protein
MDSGERIVARVPTRIAGPRRLTTNSEVATVAYSKELTPVLSSQSAAFLTLNLISPVKSKTTIPVPNILDWSDDESNPIGCEYMFMDHVPGIQLSSAWDKMSSTEHLQIIKIISDMIGQMAALGFPAFGSIYFQDAPIDPALKISLEDGFCIGPHCDPVLWNCSPGESELYGNSGGQSQGPCK